MKGFIEIRTEQVFSCGPLGEEGKIATLLINIDEIKRVIEMDWGTKIVLQDLTLNCKNLSYEEVVALLEAAQ